MLARLIRAAPRLAADLTPLRRSPAFARVWAGTSIAAIGTQMTAVAVGVQVYDLTGSTVAVSLVGAIALVPMVVGGLYAGMLADAFDRRSLALAASVVAWGSVVLIAGSAWTGTVSVTMLYVLSALNAVAGTVVATARSAIIPTLVAPDLLPAASALSGIGIGVSVTLGPALAGVLIASIGFAATYSVEVLLFAASFIGLFTLPRGRRTAPAGWPGLASVIEGGRYVAGNATVAATFAIDIVAMTLGQPRVLFPAVGAVLIGGGPLTVGVLTASFAVGALVSSVLSGPLGRVRRQGVAVGWAVTVYAAAILAFGATLAVAALHPTTRWASSSSVLLVVAGLLLAVAGAADNVSAIFRETILQTVPPDAVRGRLQGLFTVTVLGAPRLGDLYAGALSLLALAAPPLIGGAAILALTAALLRAAPSFRNYRAPAPG